MTATQRMTGIDLSFLFDGQRYCTHHQGKAGEAGGKWIVSANGRSRRWICAACLERRKAKQ